MADVFAPQPVKTKVAGDVVVNINSGQTVGLVAGAAAIGTVSVTSLPSIPTGANTIGTINIAASQTVGLVAGAAVIGALTANQSMNTTQLAGAAIAVGAGATNTGTQRVILATDQATIPVSQGLSFTTSDTGQLTSVALAAGATITLDGVQIASGVGKLFEASVSSSVALKAQIGTWDGTTFVVKRTFFIPANATLLYAPTRYDAITMATGTTAKFRWSITNNDNANAADVYASITHAI